MIRVTSDCPLICPDVIRAGLDIYLGFRSESIYLLNGEKRTYPRGMEFEIFSGAHSTSPRRMPSFRPSASM